MKKIVVTMICIIVIIGAVFTAREIVKKESNNEQNEKIEARVSDEEILDECTDEYEELENEKMVQANSEEEKVSLYCSFIIKKSDEFSSIIKKRNGVANKYFILNIENNDSNIPKFGITFVKHIGKAVTRNKLKRRTKSIIDNNKNIYQKNKKYIIIIKKEAVDITYQEMEKQLISIFKKGEQYEK